jgi:GNAT superfamily N-acetyltransferase
LSKPQIRDAAKTDQAFVASTWLVTWVKDPVARDAGWTEGKRYGECGRIADAVLDRHDTSVAIACNPDNPEEIWGWLAYAMAGKVPIVHYAYVREKHRRKGIMRQLLKHIGADGFSRGIVYTIKTNMIPFLTTKYKAAAYLPVHEWLYGDAKKSANS